MASNNNGNKPDLTTELLPSDLMGQYMSFAFGLPGGVGAVPDNPSWVWPQLFSNPWLAMAIYADLEEKDDMISSSLDVRKENVLAKSRRILPASDKRQDKKLADFIGETLEGHFDLNIGTDGRFGFDNFIWEAMDAVPKGVSIGEIIFGETSDSIVIKDVRFKPQQLFAFGEGLMASYSTSTYPAPQTGPLRLRYNVYLPGLDNETPLPENKFFVHTFRPRHGSRWGSPLMRKLFWLSWFKRAGVKNWLRTGEKGAGSVVTRYPDGAPESTQSLALDAARAIYEESVVALPTSFVVEVLEHVRASQGSSNKEFVDDFCNNGIARIIRGQTLTSRGSEGGAGGRALGEVHERVEGTKTEADAKSLMLAVNTRLVWPLTLYNRGAIAKPPLWVIDYEPGADLDSFAERLYKLWKMFVPIPVSYVYNTFQMPEPAEGEKTLPFPSANAQDDEPEQDEQGGAGFAEHKKKGARPARRLPGGSSARSQKPQSLRTDRFAMLRPSTMRHSTR